MSLLSDLRTRWFSRLSEALGEGPHRLDIDAVLCFVLSTSRERLLAGLVPEPTSEQLGQVEALLTRRERGEPLAYLLNSKEFFGREFFVSPAVLIPRPETELLVQRALSELRRAPASVFEVGVGSGAVLLTILAEEKGIFGAGSDLSPEAIQVAGENAARLGVTPELFCADLFPPGYSPAGRLVLVSNPPYIEESYELPLGVSFEPRLALFAGGDGLEVYRRLFERIKDFRDSLSVCLEIGEKQAHDLSLFAQATGAGNFQVFQDLSGRDRVVSFDLNVKE